MTMTLDPTEFRNAMARFASGVTICTTNNAAGEAVGFTASSFASLSLDPPLLLVCLQKDADCYQAFVEAEHFAVSILGHGQGDIARRFATKAIDKWAGTPTVAAPITGYPLIPGGVAQIECRMFGQAPGGDHTILVGEVVWADCDEEREPLLHYNRTFGRFALDASA
jgi:flavin reductase ActVB